MYKYTMLYTRGRTLTRHDTDHYHIVLYVETVNKITFYAISYCGMRYQSGITVKSFIYTNVFARLSLFV